MRRYNVITTRDYAHMYSHNTSWAECKIRDSRGFINDGVQINPYASYEIFKLRFLLNHTKRHRKDRDDNAALATGMSGYAIHYVIGTYKYYADFYDYDYKTETSRRISPWEAVVLDAMNT